MFAMMCAVWVHCEDGVLECSSTFALQYNLATLPLRPMAMRLSDGARGLKFCLPMLTTVTMPAFPRSRCLRSCLLLTCPLHHHVNRFHINLLSAPQPNQSSSTPQATRHRQPRACISLICHGPAPCAVCFPKRDGKSSDKTPLHGHRAWRHRQPNASSSQPEASHDGAGPCSAQQPHYHRSNTHHERQVR